MTNHYSALKAKIIEANPSIMEEKEFWEKLLKGHV